MKRRLDEIAAQPGILRKSVLVAIKARNSLLYRGRSRYRQLLVRILQARSKALPPTLKVFHNEVLFHRASQSYKYQIYPDRIILFVPEGQGDQSGRLQVLQKRWQSIAPNGVDVYPIKGAEGHLEVLEEPHVQILANQLNVCLAGSVREGEQETSVLKIALGKG